MGRPSRAAVALNRVLKRFPKLIRSTDVGRRLAEAPLAELDPYSIAGDIMSSDG